MESRLVTILFYVVMLAVIHGGRSILIMVMPEHLEECVPALIRQTVTMLTLFLGQLVGRRFQLREESGLIPTRVMVWFPATMTLPIGRAMEMG